jgi:hypothetical protein
MILEMITNFTGAALEQQMVTMDLRNAQSTMLQSDLLGTRSAAGLAPSEAVFGSSLMPLDALSLSPELSELDTLGMGGLDWNAVSQMFGGL